MGGYEIDKGVMKFVGQGAMKSMRGTYEIDGGGAMKLMGGRAMKL